MAAAAVEARRHERRPPAPVPPARPLGIAAFFRAFQDNPVTAFPEAAYREPLFLRARFGFVPAFLLVAAPDLVRQVLSRKASLYDKGDVVRRRLQPMVGDGVLIAEEASWLPQRRIIQPLFRPRLTERFLPAMVRAAEAALRRIDAGAPGPVDISAAMNLFTYDVIARTAFSGETVEDPLAFSGALGDYLGTLGRIDLASYLALPAWVPTLARLKARPALALIRRQVGGIIARRRALIEAEGVAAAPDDLLTALLTQKDPGTGAAMSAEHVYDNAVVFLAAGHETTANTLQWTLFLLSEHPEWDRRVAGEIAAEVGEGTPTAAALDRLVLTRMVVEEALRLYPPVPLIPRMPSGPDEIGGVAVGRGDLVFTAPFITHRHRAYWEAPDAFRPERFAPGAREAILEGSYFPFGTGPRACLGARFALQEVLVALSVLLRRYRFEAVAPERVFPLAAITMRPEAPLAMRPLPRRQGP